MKINSIPELMENGNLIVSFKPKNEIDSSKKIQEELTQSYRRLIEPIGKINSNGENNYDDNRIVERVSEISNQEILQIIGSKKEIIDNALDIIQKEVDAQLVSLFLFSKEGKLKRYGLKGYDRYGKEISSNWYENEAYYVNDSSFVGRAATPRENQYGELIYSVNLMTEEPDKESREKYLKKLGNLKSGIAIPLNGRNKTYGVLKIINKCYENPNNLHYNRLFVDEDIRKLTILSIYLANTLSNFRREIQNGILIRLSQLLIQSSYNKHISLEEICQEILDLLILNPETSFKAGVLRIEKKDKNSLEVIATSLSSELTRVRDDRSIRVGEGIVGKVAESGHRIVIRSIQDNKNISKFRNKKWIAENHFESFACFPIIVKSTVIGTASLYTSYKYDFYPDSIIFIQSIADLLGLFVHGQITEEMEENLSELVEDFDPLETIDAITQDSLYKEFDEITILSKLENKNLDIKTLSEMIQANVVEVQNIVKMLFMKGYIDTVGNSIIDYIFPYFSKKRRLNSKIIDEGMYFTITSKGYFSLKPILSFK